MTGKKVVRGLYDYVAVEDSGDAPDLNFKKGDVMEILQEWVNSTFSLISL